jgi:hypothetical protein
MLSETQKIEGRTSLFLQHDEYKKVVKNTCLEAEGLPDSYVSYLAWGLLLDSHRLPGDASPSDIMDFDLYQFLGDLIRSQMAIIIVRSRAEAKI